MAALIDQKDFTEKTLEAEIADCCHAIYWTSEPEVAMQNWARLRKLTAEKSAKERDQYLRETLKTGLAARIS